MNKYFKIEVGYNEESFGFKRYLSGQVRKRNRKFLKKLRKIAKRKENVNSDRNERND